MKAAVILRPGLEHLVIEDVPQPTAGAGEVLVRLRAASLNYRDTLVVRGGYGSHQKRENLIPLSDGAGEVAEVGAGVTAWRRGDRVIACLLPRWLAGAPTGERLSESLGGSVDGTAAEYRVCRAVALVRTPDHLSDLEAATLPCAALTAWSAVITQGRIGPGDIVLTQGSGGVSLFALQFALIAGATVVATSSAPHKLERIRGLGAHHLINYREEPEWGRRARAIAGGRGVDHVVEVGGPGTLAQSLRAVCPGGTISLIGVLSNAKPDFNFAVVVMNNIRLQGVTVGSKEQFERMLAAIAAHRMHPIVDRTFPLAELRRALEYLADGRHFGKVCIEV